MGVIQRQGLKSSVISYVGVAIGVLSTVFIYPSALEIVGLFRSLFDASVLIGILVLMGSSVSAIRFFPRYQHKESGHHGLLSWLLIIAGAGFLIFLAIYPLLHRWISDYIFHDRNRMYREFVIYIVPLTFLISLANLLGRYISNFRRITVPAIFEQLTIKVTLPLIVLMYLSGWLTVEGVVIGIVASYAFSALGMIYYLQYLGEWRFAKPAIWKDKPTLREYSRYSWYGLLSGIGSQVAFRIDGLMVAAMIQFQATGVYSISWALSEVIIKPLRSLASISGPVIAQHIENNALKEIEVIYRKSSLNMTIIGAGLFLLIWTVLPYIFGIMPKTEVMMQGTYVVFFLGLAQVWDMMTGLNTEIISYSRYYRFTLYLTLFLAITNVATNLIFIPLYGLTGAALATSLSMFLFNVAKLIFIKIKFGFQPFSLQLIPVVAFCLAAWLISTALPESGIDVIDLFYKGAVFSLIYGVSIWKFNLSPEISHWVDLGWAKITLLLQKSGWRK